MRAIFVFLVFVGLNCIVEEFIDRFLGNYWGKREIGEYDIVINADSMLILNGTDEKNSWCVEFANRTIYDKWIENEKMLVVAFAGIFNSGKSWAINHLATENLISDYSHRTNGISIRFPDLSGVLKAAMIDTAGVQTSIPFQNFGASKISERMVLIQDRIAVEQFNLDFLVKTSSVIIVVVNQLTYQDQQMIGRIEQLISDLNLKREEKHILILHNLQEVRTEKEMDSKILSDIERVFGGKANRTCFEYRDDGSDCEEYGYNFVSFFTDVHGTEKIRYVHFLTGHDEAMRSHNQRTFKLINKHLSNLAFVNSGLKRKFNPLEEFKRFSHHQLDSYIRCKNGKNTYQLEIKEDEEDINKMSIVLQNCEDFQQKAIMRDSLGNIMYGFSRTDFSPDYEMIYEEKGVRVIVDVPGKYSDLACTVENTGNRGSQIHISGERVDDVGENVCGNRKFGKFSIDIAVEGDKDRSPLVPSSGDEEEMRDCVCMMNNSNGVLEIETLNQRACDRFLDEL